MKKARRILLWILAVTILAGMAAAAECDHEYVVVEEQATCTDPGLRYSQCSKCGEQTGYENTPALGHDYGAWAVETEATCTKAGIQVRTCDRCNHREEQEIAALGHSYQTSVVTATCEDQGYTRYTCATCGDSYKAEYTDATGHSYSSSVTEPTCEDQGYTRYTCATCGDSYKADYTDAIGHSYTATVVEPTCEDQGYTKKTCSLCGDTTKVDYVDALGHDCYESVVEATCEKDGYTQRTCSVCGNTEKTNYIPATGHSYTVTQVEPTCTKEGYTRKWCTVCADEEKSDFVEATGHHYDDGVVIQEASTTAMGKIQYTCSGCGDHYTETTPKLYNPFVDVKKEDYFYHGVLWAVSRDITKGMDDTHFSPNLPCTRAQVVTFLWRAMGRPEPESTQMPFVDVPQGEYFYKAVLWAAEMGITDGMDSSHFSPNIKCTRAQVVTFLYRAAGCPEVPAGSLFADVKTTDYFCPAVTWAAMEEITNGMDSTHFGPNRDCAWAQVVTFLYRNQG